MTVYNVSRVDAARLVIAFSLASDGKESWMYTGIINSIIAISCKAGVHEIEKKLNPNVLITL